MTPERVDVAVIGGGAAGLFCAFHAARRGRRVRVLERAARPGKKILMSGGGRCNFTNTGTAPEHFISENRHFCKSALARYRPADFIALVDRHGIGWHEKEAGQLFCDESSKQIVNLLLRETQQAGVELWTDCDVTEVRAAQGAFVLGTSRGAIHATRVVVATGGLSVPTLGGSGFGYQLARAFGHRVVETRAGLVPFTLSGRPLEQWQDLSGLSLPVAARAQGPAFRSAMLLTHRGLSGPAMLQVSNYWTPGQPLDIDLLPDLDAAAWLAQAQRDQPGAELRSVLADVLPRRFAQRFCEVCAPSRPLRQFSAKALREIACALHAWPVQPSGTEGYRTAEVTLGGVDTRELSSATFESQRQPGLHFIGEVVDVTGWLGGYNFQWAWASAHACAQAL